ncbi:MAG: Nif3-like dinuclear metal center hexameric protein [Coriobacteriia bacterium]|nr:Nif3-like dinuclear metal center hexameric protein [Coriobacteriia bacterium]
MAFTEVDLTKDAQDDSLKVVDILLAVDSSFPFAHAFDGDQAGLLIGDANTTVKGVLVTLDAGLGAIARAQELGANVIVSHHPVRFNSFGHFNVTHVANTYPERILAAALSADIAVIAAHTNVDVAETARRYWGDKLDFEHLGPLPAVITELGFPRAREEQTASDPYGELWHVNNPRSLNQLAAEVAGFTGSPVRVFGDGETMIETIVTATGSGGGRIPEAQVANADLIISGEFGYHAALAAVESGLTLIELGHDLSELPLVDFIAEAIHVRTSIADDKLHIEDRPKLWRSVSAGAKPIDD